MIDYVKLDYEIFAKILDVKSWVDMAVPDYYCEIFNMKDNYKSRKWIDEDQIEIKLTIEERKSVKTKEDAKKYNL